MSHNSYITLFSSRETAINTSAKFRRQTRCIMGSVKAENFDNTMLKSLERMNTLFGIAFNATQLNLNINTEKLLKTIRHLSTNTFTALCHAPPKL